MLRVLPAILFSAVIAACTTAPVPLPGSSTVPAPVKTGPQPGQIAQCGHEGAPMAGTPKSTEWQARLDRVIDGGAGDELMGGPPVSAIMANDAQPLVRPIPSYPQRMLELKASGICNILLDIDVDGLPKDPMVACSREGFIESATKAAKMMRFRPYMENGRAVEQWNVVYPLTYCLEK